MELENLVAEVKALDENLGKRLEPVETALAGQDESIKAQAATIKTLETQWATGQAEMEDMRKLVKAVKADVYDPTGKYRGVWANAECSKRFGHFVMATFLNRGKSLEYLDKVGINAKAMQEGVTSAGGALVPPEFHDSLINLIETHGLMRRLATVVPIGRDDASWPKIDSDVTVYAPGEGGSITASSPVLSVVPLVCKKIAALTAISSELAEDSAIAIGELVGGSMGRAFAKVEDQAGLLGDGTSTYFGYTGVTGAFQSLASYSAQTVSTALGGLVTAAGNTYAEITLGNFDQVVGVLPSQFDDGAVWVAHKYFYFTVMLPRAQGVSSGIPTVGSAAETLDGPRQYRYRGYPVEFSSVMPKTEAASQQCAFLGNFKQGMYFGDRREFTLAQSKDVYFASDSIAIRATERFALNCFGYGTTTAAGPICALITYAS